MAASSPARDASSSFPPVSWPVRESRSLPELPPTKSPNLIDQVRYRGDTFLWRIGEPDGSLQSSTQPEANRT
jgi:hypothetical protein